MKHYITVGNNSISIISIIKHICERYNLNYSTYKNKYSYYQRKYKAQFNYMRMLNDFFNPLGISYADIQNCIDNLEYLHILGKVNNTGNYVRESCATINRDLNIDKYAVVLAKTDNITFKSTAIYEIQYSSNNEKQTCFIDYESMFSLCKHGYIAGYIIVHSNKFDIDYIQEVNSKLLGSGFNRARLMSEVEIQNIITHKDIIHVTDKLSDRNIYKIDIKALIFGNYNLLKDITIMYNNIEKTISIHEYLNIASKEVFSPRYFKEITIAKKQINIIDTYTKEDINKFKELGYRVQLGNMLGKPKLIININESLDARTAKQFLSNKFRILVTHDEIQDQYEDFIMLLSKYIGKKHIKASDKLVHTHTIIGIKGRAKYEVHLLNNKTTNDIIIADSSIGSSSLWRNIDHSKIEKIKTDYRLDFLKIDREYNSENKVYLISSNIDRKVLSTYIK